MTAHEHFASTEHFWYRLQPEGIYIDTHRDNKALGHVPGKVILSEDGGRTWPHSADFAEAAKINFAFIFKNGNILFGAGSKLYLSEDNLASYAQLALKDKDGSDYVPHTPQNPDLPGWYFHTLSGVKSWDVDGVEMLVWGNYCNVIGGAAPVNIYYSVDNGKTVRIAYTFGCSVHRTDNGSPGGAPGGTPLGDPDNGHYARHIHTVAYNPGENAFYSCTGDSDFPDGFECHWLRGTYDADKDEWDWKILLTDHLNSRYKCGGITFVDGLCYWISDSNGPEPYDRGVFCCAPEDITKPEKHTRLFNPGVEAGCMIVEDGVFLAGHCAPASPLATGFIVSTDGGKSWAQYDLKELGQRSPCCFEPKNSEGWFKVDLRSSWVTPAEVLFIKPKPGR